MIPGSFPCRSLLSLLAAVALAACSAAPTGGEFTGAGSGGATSGSGGATTGGGAASSGGAGGGQESSGVGTFDAGLTADGGEGGSAPVCATATQFVYTLTADNSLYKFNPPTLAFTLIGVLDCPTSETPYSMAVDRDGNAWSVFTDGSLWQIDTSNAHCTATTYTAGQDGFYTFGMGFSANSPGSSAETLFVSNSDGVTGLASIDLTTMQLTPIGAYDAISARAELTGTGNAELFGAFEGTPYIVAQINKTNAKIISQAPQTAISYPPDSSNFAFAFWGGDFYLFVGPGSSTDVFHYKPSDGTTTKVKSVSFEIVGAGVSTCAPLAQPT